jgi:hypothetical protein
MYVLRSSTYAMSCRCHPSKCASSYKTSIPTCRFGCTLVVTECIGTCCKCALENGGCAEHLVCDCFLRSNSSWIFCLSSKVAQTQIHIFIYSLVCICICICIYMYHPDAKYQSPHDFECLYFQGNSRHVAHIRLTKRPITEAEHKVCACFCITENHK